jgi:hypothetical protein
MELPPPPFPKRRLKQFLNRQSDLTETIEEMIAIGMLVEDGKGERGSGKGVILAVTGREFLTNFLTRLDFVFRVNPETWIDFLSKVQNKDRDAATELTRIVKDYVEERSRDAEAQYVPAASTTASEAGSDIRF